MDFRQSLQRWRRQFVVFCISFSALCVFTSGGISRAESCRGDLDEHTRTLISCARAPQRRLCTATLAALAVNPFRAPHLPCHAGPISSGVSLKATDLSIGTLRQ